MNVLLIGSGGREHAMAWKIAQSPKLDTLYCAPGNPGMAAVGTCVDIGVKEFDRLLEFAKEHDVALAVVGPEDPLAAGLADRFDAMGIRVFGPSAKGAQLESSKVFAKDLMARHGIPTAEYAEFQDAGAAIEYVKKKGAPIVVKADGLAAGKGVTVAQDLETAIQAIREAMVDRVFGAAGAKVVVEECLVGEEASILAFTDGKCVVPMVASQDHKPVFDNDEGPNTGGMGAYSPAPVATPDLVAEVERTVLRPCVDGLAKEGISYSGCLYAGLMITAQGPKVIEFNCRFGDPETQVVLPRLKSDLLPILLACADGRLDRTDVAWDDGACVTVVMASGGYPREYEKGKRIAGIEEAEREPGVLVFHAGTQRRNGDLATHGGRVLDVTATGPDVASTIEKAYRAVGKISFDQAHFRRDIGRKALVRLGLAK